MVALFSVTVNYFYLKNSVNNNLVKIEINNGGNYNASDFDDLLKIGYDWVYEVPMTEVVNQNMGMKRLGLFWGSYLVIYDSKTGKIKDKYYKSGFILCDIFNTDGYQPF